MRDLPGTYKPFILFSASFLLLPMVSTFSTNFLSVTNRNVMELSQFGVLVPNVS